MMHHTYFEPFVRVVHETISRSDTTRSAKVALKRRAAGRQRNLFHNACDVTHPAQQHCHQGFCSEPFPHRRCYFGKHRGLQDLINATITVRFACRAP